MTLLDGPSAMPELDEAQLLFQEARERRRRRWLNTGATIGVLAIVLAVTLGLMLDHSSRGTLQPAGSSPVTPANTSTAVSLNFRPVLCKAPALTVPTSQPASTGPLPTCSSSSQLTAANLEVNTSSGTAIGNPPEDPQFSSYASTPPESAAAADMVLLPGAPGQGTSRFVLGPAALTQTGIASASAIHEYGQWVVNVRLTPQGSVQWDALTQQQFHAIIGVVENGRVISAPIIQPSQSSFTSFSGQVQIAAGFTEVQAKALASGI